MLNNGFMHKVRDVPGLRGFGLLILLQIALAGWATWRLGEAPRVHFDVSPELTVTSTTPDQGERIFQPGHVYSRQLLSWVGKVADCNICTAAQKAAKLAEVCFHPIYSGQLP